MTTVDQSAEDVRMNLPGLVRALASRWVRIVGVTVLVLLTTLGILLFMPKVYESSASLLVEQRDNIYTRPAAERPLTPGISAEALMSSQIELIKSRDLLLEVVDSQNLRSVPEFAGRSFSPLALVMQLLGRPAEQRSVNETVLANLAERLTVIRERDSAVISIYVRTTDPALSAAIANAIAEAHVKRRGAQSLTDTADATVWLQQEIAKLRTSVAAADNAVANYKVDNDLFVGANATPVTDQQVSTIAAQIVEAQQRKNAAQSRSDMIRGLINAGRPLDGVADVRDSVVIQRLVESKATLQGELAQRSSTLLANHPTIKALKAQIAELETQIAREAGRVADALQSQARVEGDLEQKLREDLTRAKIAASEATRGGVTLDSLQRDAKAQRDLLESYLAKYADAVSRTDSNASLPDVRIVSVAAPAVDPASPKIPLTLAAVGFVALALQVGAVLFGELLSGRALLEARPHRDSEPELDDGLAAQLEADLAAELADTDRLSDDAAPLFEPPAEDQAAPASTPMAELHAELADRQLRVVLLAGLGRHHDCSAVADSLIAEALGEGLSAVLVDAGSAVASRLPGLSDLAAGKVDYGTVVQRLAEDLAEVPWGRLPAIDRRSDRPQTLVEALADIYHLVVVDTGRVGLSSSLPIFAGSKAALVLVTEGTESPEAIAAAEREIAALGLAVGSVVAAPRLEADVA